MWQKVLIVAPPRQDEEGIALQIKPLSHLCKYIVGPVPLPVLRKVSEGQVIGRNHIRLLYQAVFCGQDIDLVRVPSGVLVRKRKQPTGRIQLPRRTWVIRLQFATGNQRDLHGVDSSQFIFSESITQVLQSCAAKYAFSRYGSNSGRFFLERFKPHSGLLRWPGLS